VTPAEHEEHLGYARFTDAVEAAEAMLDEGDHAAAEWARCALNTLDEADALLAADGPRSNGAHIAQLYRESLSLPTVADLRERASVVLFGSAEVRAAAGEPVEADA